MPEFHELIEQLKNVDDENPLPEDFVSQLEAAHQEMVDVYTTSSATLTEQLEAATAERDASNTAKTTAQQHNARLLRTLPAKREPKVDPAPSGDDDGDDPDFPAPTTVESLIEY